MKHEIPPYRYQLPNGTVSGQQFACIYTAYHAGCVVTWNTDMDARLIGVLNAAGDRVPSYEYCDDCNYDLHACGGCGDVQSHETAGACDDCKAELL